MPLGHVYRRHREGYKWIEKTNISKFWITNDKIFVVAQNSPPSRVDHVKWGHLMLCLDWPLVIAKCVAWGRTSVIVAWINETMVVSAGRRTVADIVAGEIAIVAAPVVSIIASAIDTAIADNMGILQPPPCKSPSHIHHHNYHHTNCHNHNQLYTLKSRSLYIEAVNILDIYTKHPINSNIARSRSFKSFGSFVQFSITVMLCAKYQWLGNA